MLGVRIAERETRLTCQGRNAERVDGEPQQLALARAETGVQRLQNVTEQLLMLARLESRNDWHHSEPCSVSLAIHEALVDMPGAERVKQVLETENLRVSAPHALVVIAIRNLLENALKFSSNNQPVELGVCFQNLDHQGVVTLTIRDGGHRQSPPDHVDGSQKTSPAPAPGYGLGLTIVESIAEQFNGRLKAEGNAEGGMDWELSLLRVL